jgi:hypothetical protein
MQRVQLQLKLKRVLSPYLAAKQAQASSVYKMLINLYSLLIFAFKDNTGARLTSFLVCVCPPDKETMWGAYIALLQHVSKRRSRVSTGEYFYQKLNDLGVEAAFDLARHAQVQSLSLYTLPCAFQIAVKRFRKCIIIIQRAWRICLAVRSMQQTVSCASCYISLSGTTAWGIFSYAPKVLHTNSKVLVTFAL